MRLRILGVVCASCAATASASTAVGASPTTTTTAAAAATGAAAIPGDIHLAARRLLIARNMFFARRRARLVGDPMTLAERHRRWAVLRLHTLAELRRSTRRMARLVRLARARRFGGAPNVPIPPQLEAIARCESHGDPRAVSAGGTYRGKYQFSYSTWASVGGSGDPAAASETEQDRRAAMLYRSGGPAHWPVCGR